uniref:Receptortype tyrosineprotein phosphatase putative n=1 Tax=Albugo laibachii Nc14 TaxID=890382 RepID=F0X1Q8_9STRA|nr:receptortype tyrosineprotein phosphatase putative [Albugo laibachii Nc14]|eukprot:CCA27759.1 receptortype tyrosineprotein phosphatase putative [Albugo laibachii Nc14]
MRCPTKFGEYDSIFAVEYEQICAEIDTSDWLKGALSVQSKDRVKKNRYSDVLPYEATRVRLEDSYPNDYINANHIAPYYIACCAPLPHTLIEFWKMVWLHNVYVIVMLTQLVERGRIKAHQYWNGTLMSITEYGDISVQLCKQSFIGQNGSILPSERNSLFVLRAFKIWKTGDDASDEKRDIIHVQMTCWPDHGVPQDFRVITSILDIVNARKRDSDAQLTGKGSEARVIVHCSAGIGRSGTFIAINIVLRQLHAELTANLSEEQLSDAFNIAKVVYHLRCQRPSMVQTPQQYAMIYEYISAVFSNARPW